MVENFKKKEQTDRSNRKSSYVGPQVLYDKLFIPDHLINRAKELEALSGLIRDAVIDKSPVQISLYGVQGVGKTVLINKTLKKITDQNPKDGKTGVLTLHVNCEGNDFEQIIFMFVTTLAKKLNYKLNPDIIMKSDLPALWKLFNSMITRIKKQIILFLGSAEYVNSKIINRFCDFAKNESIIIIQSLNISKNTSFRLDFCSPDFRMELDRYSNNHLFDIGRERCEAAFKNPVEEDLMRYIVDINTQFQKGIPRPIIETLQGLYPTIENKMPINASAVQTSCEHLEACSMYEADTADFIAESDILDLVFLDNICGHFYRSNTFYISFDELQIQYQLACDNIDETMSLQNFQSTLSQMQSISLLKPSAFNTNTTGITLKSGKLNKNTIENGKKIVNNSPKQPSYFLTIDPKTLRNMLNLAFVTSKP